MLENLSKFKIILGSNSPRRKELLQGLDLPYEVKTLPNIEESYPSHLRKEEIPIHVAQLKAKAYQAFMTNETFLITADTIVWLENQAFGKPENEQEAKNMLRTLSDKTHEVITAVCLTTRTRQQTFHTISSVKFARLDDSEIDYYIKNYKPYDKAGAYGVQEWIGYIGVESLTGSFYNVMGLPVRVLYKHLKEWKE
jgi:septum formation protein